MGWRLIFRHQVQVTSSPQFTTVPSDSIAGQKKVAYEKKNNECG
jgi:hypothetical protein